MQIKKSKLQPVEIKSKKTPVVSLNDKKTKKNDFLKRFHEREVRLAQMPFWSFNFKKYL